MSRSQHLVRRRRPPNTTTTTTTATKGQAARGPHIWVDSE
eukprot:CAMPEP_0119525352 /NCGR_PEP_ID=MMETSP1344-20130328/40160_1 /TAXON_ID=236787 /ORGANISM="Florenciella parvula, Strain CCMP2471" /LENGTH=39 /DNA_ID= /DNA_START= /DNA_END= /DNA_ORIENTATION=